MFTVRETVRCVLLDLERGAETVLRNCRSHIRINCNDHVAYSHRTLVLTFLGRDAEAKDDFQTALELRPISRDWLEGLVAEIKRIRNPAQAKPKLGQRETAGGTRVGGVKLQASVCGVDATLANTATAAGHENERRTIKTTDDVLA
jgi:hypothetical protein